MENNAGDAPGEHRAVSLGDANEDGCDELQRLAGERVPPEEIDDVADAEGDARDDDRSCEIAPRTRRLKQEAAEQQLFDESDRRHEQNRECDRSKVKHRLETLRVLHERDREEKYVEVREWQSALDRTDRMH